jgi:hypothetical protein
MPVKGYVPTNPFLGKQVESRQHHVRKFIKTIFRQALRSLKTKTPDPPRVTIMFDELIMFW